MNKLKWKGKQSIHKVHKRTTQPREAPGIKKKQNEIEEERKENRSNKNEQIEMEKQTINSRSTEKDNSAKRNARYEMRSKTKETKI